MSRLLLRVIGICREYFTTIAPSNSRNLFRINSNLKEYCIIVGERTPLQHETKEKFLVLIILCNPTKYEYELLSQCLLLLWNFREDFTHQTPALHWLIRSMLLQTFHHLPPSHFKPFAPRVISGKVIFMPISHSRSKRLKLLLPPLPFSLYFQGGFYPSNPSTSLTHPIYAATDTPCDEYSSFYNMPWSAIDATCLCLGKINSQSHKQTQLKNQLNKTWISS